MDLSTAMGKTANFFFVPANVLQAQDENLAMLNAKADALNSNVPQTIALATRNGTMTDGEARRTMFDMNRATFLSSQSERELGEETGEIIKDAAAKAPGVLADAVHGGLNTIGSTIWRAIPWWIWAIIGVYVAIQLAVFVKALRTP